MKSIRDQVYEIVASTLDVRRADIRPASTWDDYQADSLDVVELILALEEKFSISFETAELKGMRSVADVVRAIEQKVQAA